MIVPVAITNRVTSTVSGIDGDYAPVCEDLSEAGPWWPVTTSPSSPSVCS